MHHIYLTCLMLQTELTLEINLKSIDDPPFRQNKQNQQCEKLRGLNVMHHPSKQGCDSAMSHYMYFSYMRCKSLCVKTGPQLVAKRLTNNFLTPHPAERCNINLRHESIPIERELRVWYRVTINDAANALAQICDEENIRLFQPKIKPIPSSSLPVCYRLRLCEKSRPACYYRSAPRISCRISSG